MRGNPGSTSARGPASRSDYFFELHRILSLVDEGSLYYAFASPATGRSQPKSSYVIAVDRNGERMAISAWIYAPDFPGTYDPSEVNAADPAAGPSEQKPQEFVRCTALEFESSGYFAGPVRSSDPRWKQGPIYTFGIHVETGAVEFGGSKGSFAVSGRIPELVFDGRDVIAAGALFDSCERNEELGAPEQETQRGVGPARAFGCGLSYLLGVA